jgi:hypothetical protein
MQAPYQGPKYHAISRSGKIKSMPFVSKAQRGYMWVHHPEIAREFESKTKSAATLPEHVRKKKRAMPHIENEKSRNDSRNA